MAQNDSGSELNTEKKNNIFKYMIVVLLFVALGIAIGIYCTKKYLASKEDTSTPEEVVESGPIDITNDESYSETINNLYAIINGNTMFYSTKGVDMSTADNNTKLILIYNYLVAQKQGTSSSIAVTYYGSGVCTNNFVADTNSTDGTSANVCTTTNFDVALFTDANKKLFNSDSLDTTATFSPVAGKSCVVDTTVNQYVCGNVASDSNVTGELESKFTIVKVTKDEDGTIKIYEKGYLLDNRSDVKEQHSEYDNIYLHSSDSTEYYYELKSADNLTFVHTFKSIDNSYYYVKTELDKE